MDDYRIKYQIILKKYVNNHTVEDYFSFFNYKGMDEEDTTSCKIDQVPICW